MDRRSTKVTLDSKLLTHVHGYGTDDDNDSHDLVGQGLGPRSAEDGVGTLLPSDHTIEHSSHFRV